MNYDNSNQGVLFKNDKKPEGSKQPDYNGTAEVNGKQVEIAAWLRTGKSGKKFLSLKFQEPRKKQAGDDDTAPRSAPKGKFDDMDDDVPF